MPSPCLPTYHALGATLLLSAIQDTDLFYKALRGTEIAYYRLLQGITHILEGSFKQDCHTPDSFNQAMPSVRTPQSCFLCHIVCPLEWGSAWDMYGSHHVDIIEAFKIWVISQALSWGVWYLLLHIGYVVLTGTAISLMLCFYLNCIFVTLCYSVIYALSLPESIETRQCQIGNKKINKLSRRYTVHSKVLLASSLSDSCNVICLVWLNMLCEFSSL